MLAAFALVEFDERTGTDEDKDEGETKRELDAAMRTLRTDYVDVLTFYYVEATA